MSQLLRVLVVEDNAADVDLIRELLPTTGPARFELVSVMRLSEARARVRQEKFDLVLLDLGLPDSQGLDTFHRMRETTPELPIVLLTGNNDQDLAIAAVKAGAQDYLIKGQVVGNLLGRALVYAVERKQAEDNLRREQNLYKDLVNTQPAGIYRLRVSPAAEWNEDNWQAQIGSHYSVDLVSDRFSEITGISRLEFQNNPQIVPERVHPEDLPGFVHQNTEAVVSLSPFGWEGRLMVSAGQIIWVRFESIPRLLENGEVIWTGLVSDISERKRAEEALVDSERRWRQILVNTPQVGIGLDPQGRIIFANEYFLKLTGWQGQEVLGQDWFDLFIPPNIRDEIRRMFVATMHSKDIHIFSTNENEIVTRTGELHDIAWSNVVTRDTQGATTDVTCLGVDLTNRKRAEDRERLAHEVLRLLNSSVDDTDTVSQILQIIKNSTGFEAVGIRLRKGEDFPYYETSGFPEKFLQSERYLCARDGAGDVVRDETGSPVLECMCGNIICSRLDLTLPFFTTGGSFWSNSTTDLLATTTEKDRQAHTRNRCNGEGYESVALIPLRADQEIIGLLQFNDRRKNQFTLEQIHFFEGLGASIGVALSRKRAVEAQRASEVRYRRLFESAKDGILILDAETGVVVDVNPFLTELLGYSFEQIQGKRIWELGLFKDILANLENFMELKRQKYARYEDLPLETADGRRIEVEFVSNVYLVNGQKVIQCNIRDITERKRAEATLRETEERYRIITENMSDTVWLMDNDLQTVYISPSVVRARGFSLAEIQVMPMEKNFAPASMPVVAQVLAEELTPERLAQPDLKIERTLELEFARKDGSNFWSEVTITLIRDHEGKPTGFVGVGRDISDRKRAELDREKLESQLRQSQKMEAVGQLAGGVAHDFNNQLTVILTSAGMALKDVDPQGQLFEDLTDIYNAAQRSAGLTRQLLAFARKEIISPQLLVLNDAIGELLKMLGRLIGESIRLTWKPSSVPGLVRIDPSQLDQILANLAVNARDAISGHGSLTIETDVVEFESAYCKIYPNCTPGPYVMLAVSDDGCGMDRETMARLFEPFFTTKERGKGTGLGLATVYGIVRQNDGIINVYSEPGKGTSFKIYLPQAQTSDMVAVTAREAKLLMGDETILLVEDEEPILKIALKILKQCGYQVLSTGSPRQAIELARQHTGLINLLLTDVVMPEMNGKELAQRIVAIRPEIKVLYMSGYTSDIIAHNGVIEEGAIFLQKPFSAETLAGKIRQAISGP